jgi:hypothetical protein
MATVQTFLGLIFTFAQVISVHSTYATLCSLTFAIFIVKKSSPKVLKGLSNIFFLHTYMYVQRTKFKKPKVFLRKIESFCQYNLKPWLERSCGLEIGGEKSKFNLNAGFFKCLKFVERRDNYTFFNYANKILIAKSWKQGCQISLGTTYQNGKK